MRDAEATKGAFALLTFRVGLVNAPTEYSIAMYVTSISNDFLLQYYTQ